MKRFLFLLAMNSNVFIPGSASAGEPPNAIKTASQSVFRIVFLRPKAELVEIPVEAYEAEIETLMPKNSFIGWWLRTVGKNCREQKKEKCPIMIDLRLTSDKKLMLPEGSASLIGNGKTVYTAPHVWSTYYDFARKLGQSEGSAQEITAQARSTFIDREVDFLLFDAQRNLILNTYETKPARIRDYSVGQLLTYLYPMIKVDVTVDHLEFMVMELSEALPQKYRPIAKAGGTLNAARPNGLSDELDYGASLFCVGMPDDPKFNLEAKKTNGTYHDLHIAEGKLSRILIQSMEGSPFIEKKLAVAMEKIHFSVEAEVFHGMSGGPILNARGHFVSLSSTNQPVPLKMDASGKIPIKTVIIGPHPSILP